MRVQSYEELRDPELVARCLGGDSLAWEALIMRYRRLIFSIPNRFGFIPADCSDVFQTVCVKLIEHLAELRDEEKVSAWLITTTTRHCIHVRSQKQRSVSDEDRIEETPAPGETTEEIRIRTDRQQKVRDTIREMSDRCRQLLELLYFDPANPSYAEIGRRLAMPVPSIGPTRARCLDKLRVQLRRRGIT